MNRNYDNFRINLLTAYAKNQNDNIKSVEHSLQEVVEQEYSDKCWWEVCKVNIFNRMYFDSVEAEQLINEIVNSCKQYGNV